MKKNLFSTMLALLTIVAMLVSVGCKNYDDDISDINKRLASSEGTIATIQSQLTSMQSTVTSLQSAQSQLESVAAGLAAGVAANNEMIKSLQSDSKANAAEISNLKVKTTELESKLAVVENAIADLKAQIAKLEASLENYYTKDQIDATLATFASQEYVTSAIADAKVVMTKEFGDAIAEAKTEIAANLEEAKTEIAANIEAAKKAAVEAAGEALTAAMTEVHNNLQAMKDSLQAQIAGNTALIVANQKLIEELQSGKASADEVAALEARVKKNEENIAANTQEIKSIQAAAAAAHEEFTAKIESALSRIEVLEGKVAYLTNEVSKQINDAIASLQNQVKDLQDRVAALEAAIATWSGAGVASVTTNDNLTAGFGQFNGVFTPDGKKAGWNGPRAAEVAALETGTWLSTFDSNTLEVSVNPVSADLSKAEFDIQNLDGVSAPVIFGAPYAYETKAASGKWYVDFVANPEAIEAFVSYMADATTLQKDFSVVVNESVRSSYRSDLFTAVISKRDDHFSYYSLAPKTIKESEMTGEYTIKPAIKGRVFDQYITGITSINGVEKVGATKAQFVADSIQYGLKVEGATLVYDTKAVAAYMKNNPHDDFYIVVKGSTLSLAGFVYNGNSSTFTVEHDVTPGPTPTEPTVYDAINDTPTSCTLVPVKPTEDDPWLNISIANAMKSFGLDDKSSDAYKLFTAADYYVSEVETPYYYTTEIGDTLHVDGLLYLGRVAKNFNKDKFVFSYPRDYAYSHEGIKVEGKTVYTTVKLKATNEQYSSVEYVIKNIPVSFIEPDWKSFTSWKAMEMVTIESERGANGTFDLDIANYFVNEYEPAAGLVDKVKASDFEIYTYVVSNTKDGACYNANYAPAGWVKSMFEEYYEAVPLPVKTTPVDVAGWKLSSANYTQWTTSQKFFRVKKNASADYVITGLQTKLCGRTVPVKDATIKVTRKDAAVPTIVFNPTVSIDYKDINNPNNYWSAYNSISKAVEGCNGTFTFTASNGKKMYFDNTTTFGPSTIAIYEDGEVGTPQNVNFMTYPADKDNVLKVSLAKTVFEAALAPVAAGNKYQFKMIVQSGLKYQDTGEYVIKNASDPTQWVTVYFDVEIK